MKKIYTTYSCCLTNVKFLNVSSFINLLATFGPVATYWNNINPSNEIQQNFVRSTGLASQRAHKRIWLAGWPFAIWSKTSGQNVTWRKSGEHWTVFYQLRAPCCSVRCCCWVMLFQNQALSVRNIEEYHFSSYVSQEIRVSATLVERCLYSMKSSRPPGDLRWNTLLAPKTESAAFLCYLISSLTRPLPPPPRDRAGLWKSTTCHVWEILQSK